MLIGNCYRCFMSLIKGVGSLFPCPICLVPSESLMKVWEDFELRTGDKALLILADAQSQSTVKSREAVLSKWSLRPVAVSKH